MKLLWSDSLSLTLNYPEIARLREEILCDFEVYLRIECAHRGTGKREVDAARGVRLSSAAEIAGHMACPRAAHSAPKSRVRTAWLRNGADACGTCMMAFQQADGPYD